MVDRNKLIYWWNNNAPSQFKLEAGYYKSVLLIVSKKSNFIDNYTTIDDFIKNNWNILKTSPLTNELVAEIIGNNNEADSVS